MGCLALLFSRQLAQWLLDDPRYAGLIRVLAVAQLGIALVNYILAVINGFMDVRRLALIQVLGSLLSIVMVIWLARWLHLYGALLALIAGQLLWLVVVGVVNSAISIYYYLRIVTAMYFREANAPFTVTRDHPGNLSRYSRSTVFGVKAA